MLCYFLKVKIMMANILPGDMNRIGPVFEVKVLKYFQFLGKAGHQSFEKKKIGFGKIKNSSRPKPRRGFFDFSDEPPTHTRLQ